MHISMLVYQTNCINLTISNAIKINLHIRNLNKPYPTDNRYASIRMMVHIRNMKN